MVETKGYCLDIAMLSCPEISKSEYHIAKSQKSQSFANLIIMGMFETVIEGFFFFIINDLGYIFLNKMNSFLIILQAYAV